MPQKPPALEDTIIAIATPLGEGGLGVLRIAGPEALKTAANIFRAKKSLLETPSHTAVHGRLMDGDTVLDECVATVFRAPRSYTGEDVVELSCHGGVLLMKRALALGLAAGARMAEPGEFTRRAFLNGKMDLAQAEAVGDLIAAQSETMRRLSVDQLEGKLSAFLQGVRRAILDLLAQMEANLDFVDDEVPALPREEFLKRAAAVASDISALLATAPQGRLVREGLRIAIVGKPNAGKSSLFNALLRADRAIVTDIPGTTRDTLEEKALLGSVPVVLTDTAGLRAEGDAVEKEGMARTRRAFEHADRILWVMDASRPFSDEDERVAKLVSGRNVVPALNKSDLLPDAQRNSASPAVRTASQKARDSFGGDIPLVLTSAVTGLGLDDLRLALLGKDSISEASQAPTVVRLRHENLLRQALAALEEARRDAEKGLGDECLSLSLRKSLESVDQITGEQTDDAILDSIFSKFCIGK